MRESHHRSGEEMHELATQLFPICRSITGDGVRKTLAILQERIPLTVTEIPSGTIAFDWKVPKEWNVREAYIEDEAQNRIVDFTRHTLHVVGYSSPVDAHLSLAELQPHLHSLPDMPDAIPYVTSYYREDWGFCITHNERERLKEGTYHVRIDSELKDGSLTYGEYVIPGESEKEVLLSTYVCHPSLANDNLSGPVVATYLAQWLAEERRRYTYRIVFIPETIGALVYLARNLASLKQNVTAGFVLTCLGDERAYSYLPSRSGATFADRIATRTLSELHPGFIRYTFLDRGSDERQYCAPGVDLPVVSIMRSKYETYPEYHTSKDDLSFITSNGLHGSFEMLKQMLQRIEKSVRYVATTIGEPQLGQRGLYEKEHMKMTRNILAYADGTRDVDDLVEAVRAPRNDVLSRIERLQQAGLLVEDK
ncbi:MAG TPA: DUF4910 domain-containing protein [Candidatus Paceibacterota bacterium]|nr:DUF4910 domain-containing protein [Candidatus Paceibacterota bacterium]